MYSNALHASPGASGAARSGAAALLVFLALLLAPAPLTAQQAGDVEGTVVTAGSGAPLSDVMVRVEGTTRGAITDAHGSFRIPAVPADVSGRSCIGHLCCAAGSTMTTANQTATRAATARCSGCRRMSEKLAVRTTGASGSNSP